MTTGLTRREFVGAVAAAGLASTSVGAASGAVETARYVHAEIGAGPWSRGELSRIASRIAADNGLGAMTRMTGLGVSASADSFPEEFAVTLEYASGARVVMVARRRDARGVDVVARTERGIVSRSVGAG